jgi:hypothetical protein
MVFTVGEEVLDGSRMRKKKREEFTTGNQTLSVREPPPSVELLSLQKETENEVSKLSLIGDRSRFGKGKC